MIWRKVQSCDVKRSPIKNSRLEVDLLILPTQPKSSTGISRLQHHSNSSRPQPPPWDGKLPPSLEVLQFYRELDIPASAILRNSRASWSPVANVVGAQGHSKSEKGPWLDLHSKHQIEQEPSSVPPARLCGGSRLHSRVRLRSLKGIWMASPQPTESTTPPPSNTIKHS